MNCLLLVGVEPDEISELRSRLDTPFVSTVTLPRIKVERGALLVERPNAAGHFLPISKVVFHGIYENDFDFINALALWGGPCLPSADGMMDLRLRLPGLVRSLRVSRFNGASGHIGNVCAVVSFCLSITTAYRMVAPITSAPLGA